MSLCFKELFYDGEVCCSQNYGDILFLVFVHYLVLLTDKLSEDVEMLLP